MAAVMSPSHSPTSSPHNSQSPPSNPTSQPSLPPLITNHPLKRTALQRPPSYARNRMSSYSATSKVSDRGSRPASFAFPAFHSSLPYTLVRDFAYPIVHPWHYGAPPEASDGPSGDSTPASEKQRRFSDTPSAWDGANSQWSAGPWSGDGFFTNQQLPQMAYGDGPPYSEDEDLHSPVVQSSRHKKSKTAPGATAMVAGRETRRNIGEDIEEDEGGGKSTAYPRRYRGYDSGDHEDGSGNVYNNDDSGHARGLISEPVAYPPGQGRQTTLAPMGNTASGRRDSHFATLPNRSYLQGDEEDSDEQSLGVPDRDDSRYSRDYQFTITSPDEEMHGKAVALFDFARENENELPLTEGQIVWVSYRHGQGWLVAEDPKTRDAGLIPEEYVRLLRDIEGGWSSLSGAQAADEGDGESPVVAPTETAATPTQPESGFEHGAQHSNGSNMAAIDKRPPVVSTFSTSSKDLDPYPHPLNTSQARATPPLVNHYGSQSNTPTIRSPMATTHGIRTSEDSKDPKMRADDSREVESGDGRPV